MSSLKYLLLIIPSLIAASGTFPYGWRFAELIPIASPYIFFTAAILFSTTSTLANAILGFYSLLQSFQHKFNIFYIILSMIAAIPLGFICFSGYEPFISLINNLIISCTVTIVNMTISYSALLNFDFSFLKRRLNSSAFSLFLKILAFSIGIVVSTVLSFAAIDRLFTIFSTFNISPDIALISSNIIGIILWIPNAALFGNSTQYTVSILHSFLSNFRNQYHQIKLNNILIFVFSMLSASAFAQMNLDFTAVTRHIPVFMKSIEMQMIIHYIITPMAFLSISSVNLVALIRLLPIIEKIFSKSINQYVV